MADKKISALTASTTPLAGTEVLPIVQGGSTVKVAVSDLTAGRATSAASFIPTGSTVPVNGVYLPTADTVAVATNSTKQAEINSSGYVGIGVSPNLPLELNKAGVTFTGTWKSLVSLRDASNAKGVVFGYDDSTQTAIIVSATSSAPSNLAILTWDGVSWDDRFIFQNNGNLSLKTGNLIQGTAAKGINFTANTPAAGMTSQLLNWYEEGTWTPELAFGGASTGITYTSRTATYTRIGCQVRISCKIVLSSKGSATGFATITGLPFSSGAGSFSNGLIDPISAMANLTAGGAIFAGLGASDSTVYFLVNGTVNRTTLDDTNFQNTSQFAFDLTYTV